MFYYFNRLFCHFDGGEIFASNSAMRIQSLSSFSWRFLVPRNDKLSVTYFVAQFACTSIQLSLTTFCISLNT
jgi:hypothetical protein